MANQTEQYKIILSVDGKDNTQAIDNVNKKLDDMSSGVGKTTQAWDGFKNGVSTALGAFAIAGGFAAAVMQVNELGRAANAADVTFTQLAGGTNEAAQGLAQLRQATGGVVDDMTLMQGANSLMLTGLAQTTQEAANLTEVAVKLGGAMGQNAADAIQNLNAALLNNSFERLDMLGISAGAVRARVNELKEAGLDMSEAFAQATLEQGQIALEKLGTAADVSNTAMARLQTRANNFGQDAAQVLAGGLETAATSLEQLLILMDIGLGGTGGLPQLEAIKAQYESLLPLANQFRVMNEALSPSETNQFSFESAVEFVASSPELASQFSSAGENAGQYFARAFNGQNPEMAAEARSILEQAFGSDFSWWSDATMANLAAELDLEFKSAADASRALEVQTEQTTIALEEQSQVMSMNTAWDTFNQSEMQAVDNMATMRNELALFNDVVAEGAISTSGNSFFDPAMLGQVTTQAQELVDEYERLKAIGEATAFELVSEAEVERAREIAESASNTAEQSERNARAWETASLAMIAGASGGGRLNEFNQMVLGQIEDPELRAQAEGQFNLASGVETANTQVLEYGASLVTAITETFGVAAGTRAGQDFVTSFEEGVQLGLEGEALQDYVEGAVGYALSGEGGGQEVQVQAGEGYIALAQRTGVAREDLEAATGGGMLQAGQIIQVGDGSTLVAVNGTPEDLVTSVLATAGSGVLGSVGYGMSQSSVNTPQDAFTYYDPATQSFSGSNQMATEIISPEQSDAILEASNNLMTIQDTSLAITETDLSMVFDPITQDIEASTVQVLNFEDTLNRVASSEIGIQLPISFVFDNTTAELLARNSSVVEVFKLVLPQIGVPLA